MSDKNAGFEPDALPAAEATALSALSTLEPIGALTIDMQEAIRRGNAELIYADERAVFLRHSCGVFMLWCADVPSGERALDEQKKRLADGADEYLGMFLCVAHGEAAKQAVLGKTKLTVETPCIQFCRFSKEKLPMKNIGSIRQLTLSDLDEVNAHYDMGEGHNERAISAGLVYGLELDGKLAGFIGMHPEGSVGMLEVFPEYRRMGLGTELESFMHNLHIERGWIPYGHVYTDNAASLEMQAKFGLTRSNDLIWWTFPPDDESEADK